MVLAALIGNTKPSDVVSGVVASFGVDVHNVVSWLKTLVAARNACAHGDSYSVKGQIPLVPRRVLGCHGDHTDPLYVLLIIHEMLVGRQSFLIEADAGRAERFDREAQRIVSDFLPANPCVVSALRIPQRFCKGTYVPLSPVRWGSEMSFVEYRVVAWAA